MILIRRTQTFSIRFGLIQNHKVWPTLNLSIDHSVYQVFFSSESADLYHIMLYLYNIKSKIDEVSDDLVAYTASTCCCKAEEKNVP